MKISFLNDAEKDFKFLLDRKYKRESALNFVVDHYHLKKEEKNFLLRRVFSEEEIRKHRKKLIPTEKIKNENIVIDTYNVLITLETILSKDNNKKKFLVHGMDGFLRDFRGIHASYKFNENSKKAIKILIKILKRYKPKFSLFVLDSQISKSGKLASHIRKEMQKTGLKGDAKTERRADSFICKKNWITFTSDTIIIEKIDRVVDICAGINIYLKNYVL